MALRLAADENFNGNVVRGLTRRCPGIDLIRIQDVGLSGAEDPAVLEWEAREGRVLLTHDVTTMTRYALERIASGLPMPGLVEVAPDVPVGQVIDDLQLMLECSLEGEWESQIRYLPWR